MTKFTEAEVRARAAILSPPPAVLSRLRVGDPNDLVTGVKDIIARVLNADVDGLFYLCLLHMKADRIKITKALAALADISRMSGAAQRQTPSARNYLPQILAVLSELEDAPAGERARLTAKLAQLNAAYVSSCRTAHGAVYVGVPSTTAAAAALASVAVLDTALAELGVSAGYLHAAMRRYKDSDFWAMSPSRHARYARAALEEHAKVDNADPSAAILDSLVSASLISQNSSVNNPELPKFSGAVDMGDGLPPKETGGFYLPKALPKSVHGANLVKSINIDSLYAGTVTYPLSPSPTLIIPTPLSLFSQQESGSFREGDGVTTIYPEFLKTTVVPGSVVITAHNVAHAVMRVEDDGVGGWNLDAVAGSIDYLTGIATVTFNAAVRAYDAIHWSYSYNAVGNMKVHDAGGNFVSNFNVMDVFRHNTLKSATLDQGTVLVSAATLAAEMDNKFAAAPIYVADDGNTVVLTSDLGGAYAQLMLPAYTGAGVLNPVFGAPTWSAAPVKLNDALSAVYSLIPRAFGRDTTASDVVFSAPVLNKAYLAPQEVTLYAQQTYTITAGDKNKVAVIGVTGLTAGTSFVEFISPVYARIGVLSVAGSLITLEDTFPFPVTTGVTLAASVDVMFSVKDATTDLASRSLHSSATIAVTVGALWPAGLYNGYSTALTLASAPASAYGLRPGDKCFQGETEIGVVHAVDGTAVKMELNSTHAFYPNPVAAPLVYPYTTLTFHSLGNTSMVTVQKTLLAHILELERVHAGMRKAIEVYIHSGVGYTEASRYIAEITAALSAYDALLSGYAANRVDAVDRLLASLESERMSGVVNMLRSLQFDYLDFASPEEMSDQVDLGTMLQEAAEALGANEAGYTITLGDGRLDDFTSR